MMFDRKFEEELTTLSEKPEAKFKSSFRLHFFAFLALMSAVWLAALLFLATGFAQPRFYPIVHEAFNMLLWVILVMLLMVMEYT